MAEKSKASLIQSKSSYGVVVTDSEKVRCPLWMSKNATFKPQFLKRRGLYVEKKSTPLSFQEIPDNNRRVLRKRAPCSPVNNNKFIKSVSSKGTSETNNNKTIFLDRAVTKCRNRNKYYTNNKMSETTSTKLEENKVIRNGKNSKFKSKVLNSELEKLDDTVCIYPFKQCNRACSSNYFSSCKSIEMESSKDMISKMRDDSENLIKGINSEAISSGLDEIASEVLEKERQRKYTNCKIQRDDDTLVSKESKKIDKSLYNFIVDLLEISFNGSDKRDTSKNPKRKKIGNTSKMHVKINESVGKKLRFKESDMSQKPLKGNNNSHNLYFNKNNHYNHFKADVLKNYSRKLLPTSVMTQKLKTQTFAHSKDKKKVSKSRRLYTTCKKWKRNTEKNLISLFKKQLTSDTHMLEEPRNFYDALKIMAHRRRREDIARDDVSKKIKTYLNNFECEFNSPKLLQTKHRRNKSKTYKTIHPLTRYTNSYMKKNHERSVTEMNAPGQRTASYYSLAVTHG